MTNADFNATLAADLLMSGDAHHWHYSVNELLAIMDVYSRRDQSKPLRSVARYLDLTGDLPERDRYLAR